MTRRALSIRPYRVASKTAETGFRPRFRPKLSGRVSSYRTEAFIPPDGPSPAARNVPESWNTNRSTAGAFVITMFASS